MDIRSKVLALLATPNYHPLRRADIAGKLRLTAAERRDFRRVLTEMVEKGEVARVRKDKFVLPETADLVSGKIQLNEKGFAFVVREPVSDEPDIFIGEEDTGVAMHGDRVLVRLQRERRGFRGADKSAGRVIRILERAHDTIVGTLQKSKHFHYVIPDDPKFVHDVYVKIAARAEVGDKVVVKLAEWTSRHTNPEGEIVEVLGKSGAPGVDILSIIRNHQLPMHFAEQTLAEVDRIPETISLDGRRDLRKEFIVTIDPDDAKDFDDAVNVDELPDGGWRLGVHIADVSHYVRPGSALDREANARGNSVYLVDRVIPMLPEKLSNGLCSLRPRQDRYTVSCFIEFDAGMKTRKVEFARSLIHSRHRLTYKEAFARLTGRASLPASHSHDNTARQEPRPPRHDDELTLELKKMWRLAEKLRRQRFTRGSLDLEFAETKVRLDKNGKPTHIEKIEYDISHQLIEEFMLAANEAVARFTCERQSPGMFRIHEDPDLGKLKDFRVYAQSFGYKVGDVTHRQELQKLLKTVKGKPEEYAISLALLRSLKRARYSAQPVGHYGLAKKYYTHFTSPIRRYADLVVHRTLLSLLKPAGVEPRNSLEEIGRIAEHCSKTERAADEAEKESVELKKLEYFQQQLLGGKLDAFEAVVCSVKNFGIFVELPESLVQGLVHVSTLEDDFYEYDALREQLVGRRTKRIIRIGDKLKVQVERVDVFKRQIDFRVLPSAPAQRRSAR